jgi:hypothetical protein
MGSAWQNTGLIITREDVAGCAVAADLPPIRLHDLRHTAASLALQADVPMKVVSEQLGDSSPAITADTYTSVLPAVAHAAAEAVADTVPCRFSKAGKAPENGQATAPLPVRSHAGFEEGSVNSKQ